MRFSVRLSVCLSVWPRLACHSRRERWNRFTSGGNNPFGAYNWRCNLGQKSCSLVIRDCTWSKSAIMTASISTSGDDRKYGRMCKSCRKVLTAFELPNVTLNTPRSVLFVKWVMCIHRLLGASPRPKSKCCISRVSSTKRISTRHQN